ncbi:haloacid dehalogenase [Azoarcus sp. DD4]|uniref:cation-translocating P-type ATPase n=1 Tax=Azoarcus sp. DD4 TaxID=2027405 RepID=UPI00112CE2C3|nr:cation-translocating P-type ATPase [Azoarcus sp. DD4]QDF97897.1 haloacid dehalogenase [Azoarcus sp. DD4]
MTKEARLRDPAILEVAEVARALDTDPERGLSAAEARRRLAEDGRNTLRTAPPLPSWRRLLRQLHDPLIYLLLAAVVVTLAAWIIDGGKDWPYDAIVIVVIVVLNAILGYVQEARAENAAAALARLTAATSTVLRDGAPQRIPSEELVCGDVLVLAEGDAVGADARLVKAADLRIREASLTGESEAVRKHPATLAQAAATADQLDMVFSGTSVAQGNGVALVTATGMSTQMGAIATLLERTREDPTPLQREVSRIGRMLGAAVIVIAAIVVATVLIGADVHGTKELIAVLLLGVSLAVAAVPEGLPAILSVVLALGVLRMASRNAIVKRLSSVETLGSASVICSDKTGTLTRSEMTIERIVTASGTSRVSGVGYAPEGEVEHEGKPLTGGPLHAEHVVVLSGGSLAGNADLRRADGGLWEIQGDPTEAAFLVAERKLGLHERRQRRFERIGEVPFSSERKMMSVIALDHEHDDAVVLIAKGAPDVLLERCTRVRVGMEVVALDTARRAQILAEVDELSDAALRTLAVAYRPLAAGEDADATQERDLIFVGTVGIIDPPRAEVKQAIAEARRAGIRIIMITGDHPRTAARIAADLGIVAPGAAALTGIGLDALDDAALVAAVRDTSVFARVSPAHKLRIVDALQADGQVVAMTGDGVNDAPALKSADIGVAMGGTGTEVTKQAAKMILADDNFATIVEAVREGRGIFDNIAKFLRYLLSSNMGEVLTIFLGVIGAGVIGLAGADGHVVALPLLATQILWINLLTDAWPAMAMGVDPQTEDVMARPPRRRSARLIDARMWADVVQTGLAMALTTLLSIDLFLPGGLIEGGHSLDTARTAGFTVLVFAQLFNCFNARSATASAFHRPFVNRWLWAAVGFSVVLQVAVVHLDILNRAFGTVPLMPAQWLLCATMSSAVLWASELRKLLLRALHRPGLGQARVREG